MPTTIEVWGKALEVAEAAARRFADQPETVAKLRAVADECRSHLAADDATDLAERAYYDYRASERGVS